MYSERERERERERWVLGFMHEKNLGGIKFYILRVVLGLFVWLRPISFFDKLAVRFESFDYL